MSREIDLEKSDSWSADEEAYLAQRGQLPANYDKSGIKLFTDPPEPGPYIGDVGTVPEILPDQNTGEPVVINPASDEYLVNNPPPGLTDRAITTPPVSPEDADVSLRPGAQAGEGLTGAPDDEVPPYDQWENEELRQELKVRGLSTSGRKADMVARLEQHDAAAGEDATE